MITWHIFLYNKPRMPARGVKRERKTLTEGLILKEQNIGEGDKLITALTVEKGLVKGFAKGAKNIKSQNCAGTQLFTYSRLCLIDSKSRDTYTISEAKAKQQFITNPAHLVLKAAHPSPLSAYNGFFGCRHFSKANKFLEEKGLGQIDWSID